MQDLYQKCEPVPELHRLQDFRDDDRQCVKLYSDPGMFFKIWREEMLKAAKKTRLQKKEDRRKSRRQKADGNAQRKNIKVNSKARMP